MNAKSQHLETTTTTTLHNTMDEKERKFIKNYKQNKMGNKKLIQLEQQQQAIITTNKK